MLNIYINDGAEKKFYLEVRKYKRRIAEIGYYTIKLFY